MVNGPTPSSSPPEVVASIWIGLSGVTREARVVVVCHLTAVCDVPCGLLTG